MRPNPLVALVKFEDEASVADRVVGPEQEASGVLWMHARKAEDPVIAEAGAHCAERDALYADQVALEVGAQLGPQLSDPFFPLLPEDLAVCNFSGSLLIGAASNEAIEVLRVLHESSAWGDLERVVKLVTRGEADLQHFEQVDAFRWCVFEESHG